MSVRTCLEIFVQALCTSLEKKMDDSAKGGLPQFWEIFTVIPCAPKDFKRQEHCYLKTFGSQMKNEGFLKVEEAFL